MTRAPFQTPIAVRAFTRIPGKAPLAKARGKGGADLTSGWQIIFDTETTTCPAQKLRVGFAQVRNSGKLDREIAFHGGDLSETDMDVLRRYCAANAIELITVQEFRTKVILDVCYRGNGTLIGLNLPFDISRIAYDWGEARGNMRGGFSFGLTKWKSDPHIRVKHLSPSAALIDLAIPGKQLTGRGMRNRDKSVPHNRGSFVDIKTLAGALLTGRFSLKRLAERLNVPTQKLQTEEHGGALTFDYLDYARADVQATWECFEVLAEKYAAFELETPIHRILSEASLGKALLAKMGVRPLLADGWDALNLEDFGSIISTYYGGRAEVRIRKQIAEVIHTDFKSMYPTVNALIGLHDFLTADGFETHDATDEVRTFLADLSLADLQDKAKWRELCVIVELEPEEDLLPVRAPYNPDKNTLTIGLNHLTSKTPLWYALPDLAASKILTGKTPRILRAKGFRPGSRQQDLQAVHLMGRADCLLDPNASDLFTAIINMRDRAKAIDDPIEKHLKILANSTGYGVYAEIIRDDAPKPEPLELFGPDGELSSLTSTALEEPGRFFHPLLATLITSGARLMLACAEKVTLHQELGWAFCDTDSLAIARPDGMSRDDFRACVEKLIDWFVPLNPYDQPGSILQIEKVNYEVGTEKTTKVLEPLYCWAISAKRYALFNTDAQNLPVLRKASAHGLGQLMDPYGGDDPAPGVRAPNVDLSEIGVKRWQYDLWYHVLIAAIAGNPNRVPLDFHDALKLPALMRYGATSPALLRWMKHFNAGKPPTDQVKPFGFMVAPTAKGDALSEPAIELADDIKRGRPRKQKTFKPISPFERDPAKAAQSAFDRETGEPVPLEALQSYAETLGLYHVSAEHKFENGDRWDRGPTERRHVVATGIILIGKEANKVGYFGEGSPTTSATNGFALTKV